MVGYGGESDPRALTEGQRQALTVATRVCGSLSIVCDLVIIHGCMRKGMKSWTTYYRIMLSMATFDLLTTVWYVVADAPLPAKGEPTSPLCSAQGFFQQIGLAVPLLNATLATNYLFVLKFEWPAERIVAAEPYVFGFIVSVSLAVAITPLPLNLYHDAFLWCWISEYPPGCTNPGTPVDCEYGANAWLFQIALFYGPLWITIAYTIFVMGLVISVVYDQDRQVGRFLPEGTAKLKFEQTTRLVRQATLYCAAFLLTWVFVTALRIYNAATSTFNFVLSVFAVSFVLLQGVFNMLVFVYPRFVKLDQVADMTCCDRILFLFNFIEAPESKRSAFANGHSNATITEPRSFSETQDNAFGEPSALLSANQRGMHTASTEPSIHLHARNELRMTMSSGPPPPHDGPTASLTSRGIAARALDLNLA